MLDSTAHTPTMSASFGDRNTWDDENLIMHPDLSRAIANETKGADQVAFGLGVCGGFSVAGVRLG